VLDDGGEQAALVVCEVLALDRSFVAATRAAVQEATSIPGENVMIAGTHTHAGPATIFLRDCGEVDQAWMAVLRERLVALVGEARRACARRISASGAGCWPQGRQSPDQGRIDGWRAGVLHLRDGHAQPIATLLNYACHPTVLGHTNR